MSFIEKIQEKLAKLALPGKEAQYKLAHVSRPVSTETPEDAVRAAVLILLFQEKEQWHTLLIERVSNNPFDKHKGQISFPGGRFDETDVVLEETALREAFEEVGIDKNHIRLLGGMTDIYIPVSNFHVFPFVGVVAEKPNWIPQTDEVENLIEVSIATLQNPETLQVTTIQISEFIKLDYVPCYMVQGHTVWGATAMMISEFLTLISDLEVEI